MRNSLSNLKHRLLLCAHAACVGLLCLSWSTAAFAEGCDGLDENEEWVSEFSKLNEDYKVEDWKSALSHGKNLENICEFSPLLNYTIAHIHKKMGNEENICSTYRNQPRIRKAFRSTKTCSTGYGVRNILQHTRRQARRQSKGRTL